MPLLILCLLLPNFASGSGSYRSGAPRKSGGGVAIDLGRFELGRRLYAGMLRLAEPDPSVEPAQLGVLKTLAQRLPVSETRSAERLRGFSGRLSEAQIEALKYFLQQRFDITE